MLRVNVRSLVVLVGVLSLFCGSPAEAEAQLGSRLFRGRCLPRLFQQCPPQCPQPCPCPCPCLSRGPSMVFGCDPCPTYLIPPCTGIDCKTCSFSYNGDNKWEYDYYDCDKSCHCPLPTEINPSVVKGTMDCFQIPSAMSDRAFALELEDARRDFKKFFFTVPDDADDNEAWEYMIYMRNAKWKVKIHNAPSGTVDLCTASVSPLSPKTSRFTRHVATERSHDVANCHEHIFSYLVTNSSGQSTNKYVHVQITRLP